MPPPEGTVLPHLAVARNKPVRHSHWTNQYVTHTEQINNSQNIRVLNTVVTYSFHVLQFLYLYEISFSLFMIYLIMFSEALIRCNESLNYYWIINWKGQGRKGVTF